jgi:hypothetical protein
MLNWKISTLLYVKRNITFPRFFDRLFVKSACWSEQKLTGHRELHLLFAASIRSIERNMRYSIFYGQCNQRKKLELTGTTGQLPGILLMALGMVWAQDTAYSTGTFLLIESVPHGRRNYKDTNP